MDSGYELKLKNVTPQLTQDMAGSILVVGTASSATTTIFTLSSLAVNIVLGVSLKYLWNMINIL